MNPVSSSLGPLGPGTHPSSGPVAGGKGQLDVKKPESGSFRDSMKEVSRPQKPDNKSPSGSPADKRPGGAERRDETAAQNTATRPGTTTPGADGKAASEPENLGSDITLAIPGQNETGQNDMELALVAISSEDPVIPDSAGILTSASPGLLLSAEVTPLSATGGSQAASTPLNSLLNTQDPRSGQLTAALLSAQGTAGTEDDLAASLTAVNVFSTALPDAQLNPVLTDRLRLSGLPVQLQVQLENTALSAEVPPPLTDADAGAILHRNSPATPNGSTTFTDSLATAQDSLRTAVPVSVTFGHEKWHQLAAERTVSLLQQGVQSADIMLDPPELGPLQVRIQVQHDQAVVQFTSANAAVREALDQTIPRLREMLQEQGMSLLHAGVSDQSSGESSSRQQEEGGDTSGSPVASTVTATSQPDAPQVITLKSGIDDFA